MPKKKKRGKIAAKKKKSLTKKAVKARNKPLENDLWNDEPEFAIDPYSDDESEDEYHTVLGADN